MNRKVFKSDIKNVCGENIRRIRRDVLKISQKRLSEKFNAFGVKVYTTKEISLIENKKLKVSDIELLMFAKVLGVSVDILVESND